MTKTAVLIAVAATPWSLIVFWLLARVGIAVRDRFKGRG